MERHKVNTVISKNLRRSQWSAWHYSVVEQLIASQSQWRSKRKPDPNLVLIILTSKDGRISVLFTYHFRHSCSASCYLKKHVQNLISEWWKTFHTQAIPTRGERNQQSLGFSFESRNLVRDGSLVLIAISMDSLRSRTVGASYSLRSGCLICDSVFSLIIHLIAEKLL